MASLLNGLNICADLIGMPVVLLLECAGACCGEFFRGNARIRRPPSFMVAALVLCAFLLITTLFAGANTARRTLLVDAATATCARRRAAR